MTGAPSEESETKIGLATTWVVLVMPELAWNRTKTLRHQSYFIVANPGIIRILVEALASVEAEGEMLLDHSLVLELACVAFGCCHYLNPATTQGYLLHQT